MFTTFFIIAIPVLFVVIGTAAALSFAKESTDSLDTESWIIPTVATRPPAVLFKPLPRAIGNEAESLKDLVAAVEAHLRREREAAQNFTLSPSTQTLWVN
jgi:hypothetical protein